MQKIICKKLYDTDASEIVKKVTLPTNLVYSDFFSNQCGNKVYLKPENMQSFPRPWLYQFSNHKTALPKTWQTLQKALILS